MKRSILHLRARCCGAPHRGRRPKFEQLEPRTLLAATPIEIFAAGATGSERMELQIDGATVAAWNNVGGNYNNEQYLAFNYTHPTDVTADRIRVAFTNDGPAAGGADRNLRVENITVAGQVFPTESPSTFSTGTYINGQGCVPGFHGLDRLHCNGYFQYQAAGGSQIQVFAAGNTGQEQMQLQVRGETVATWTDVSGDYQNRNYVTFNYSSPTSVAADDIRVRLVDGTSTSGGGDRNLRVDGITIDGVKYESEAASTYSTGTFLAGQGVVPGFVQRESLHSSGYFQFSSAASGQTLVEVQAAGQTGQEELALEVNGSVVKTWSNIGGDYNTRDLQTLAYVHPTGVTPGQVRVLLVDGTSLPGGGDRNMRVGGIAINSQFYASTDSAVYSTGTFINGLGCVPGFWQADTLHCTGAMEFESTRNPGILALGETQYAVSETESLVRANFVRAGGSDGTVTLDYTTVNGDATAGQDFSARAGTLVFAPGETEKFVDVPILNDGVSEGAEVFSISADLVTGGAGLGQPRTATVTIFDDEQSSPGIGIGLRGEYFDDQNLTQNRVTRTDPTVNYNWGNGSPDPVIGANTFSARWTGQVQPLYSQTYTFSTRTDDGVRLWVNDQLIIDEWINQQPTTHSGQISLTAGVLYDIRMEYFEAGGGALAELRWSSPSQSLEIIPARQLYSEFVSAPLTDFVGQTIITGLSQPTAMEFGPGGMMFIAQKDGRVRIVENGILPSQNFVDIRDRVNDTRDRGMLGLAIHPDFATNPYVYLLYTHDPPEAEFASGLAGRDQRGNRASQLLRVTADASNGYRTAVPGSEVVILGTNSTWDNISRPDLDSTDDNNIPPSCQGVDDCLPSDSQSHTIGGLAFGTDGMLYVTNGDGTSYGRVDPRTTRVQDLNSLSGKVLRIDPITGAGLGDNPFFTGNTGDNASKVYSYGLRNPFRIAIEPNTGEPFVGDVGWTRWEEINTGRGENFGWPYYEGGDAQSIRTGGYENLPEAIAFYASNPDVQEPLWARDHSDGARAVALGDFYTGDVYPSAYDGTLFFTDYGEPTIRALQFDGAGNVTQELLLSDGVDVVVEMTMGPDGYMYYVDLVAGVVGRFELNAAALRPQTATFSSSNNSSELEIHDVAAPVKVATENEASALEPDFAWPLRVAKREAVVASRDRAFEQAIDDTNAPWLFDLRVWKDASSRESQQEPLLRSGEEDEGRSTNRLDFVFEGLQPTSIKRLVARK